MNNIITTGPTPNLKFEKAKIHDGLIIVREESRKGVIGYLNFHPLEQSWFWFIMNEYSLFYNTEDEAMESLIHTFLTEKYNNIAKKIGTFNNEQYTKK